MIARKEILPMTYDTLLPSVIHIRCTKCNIEHEQYKPCPKCGETGGFIVLKTANCIECKYFMTDQMCFPDGKCKKHNIMTGIKKYCRDFHN